MSQLPIFLDLEKTEILIAGTNGFAVAKIRLLLNLGANITALTYDDTAIEKSFGSQIKIIKGSFRPEILKDIKLIYLAHVSDAELSKFLDYSKQFNIPLNHIDHPDNSDFTTPAIIHRGPITVAVSTNGKAPVLARNLRQKIEQILPAKLGGLVDLIHEFRPATKMLIKGSDVRRKFWNKIYSDRSASKLLKLDNTQRRSNIIKMLSTFSGRPSPQKENNGHVLLVGAGPGDPELLTLKAHRALIEADVIIYDNLVSKEVLSYARRDAEMIFVGKSAGHHSKNQTQINEIITDEALKGKLTVRLKGGDPMIFGRIAEEISAIKAKNISYEIIPGITAASGAAASGSIPLTHRELSSQVSFVTGHFKDGAARDWKAFANDGHTIVIYMGLKTAGQTMKDLIRDGFSSNIPIGIIENATCVNERRLYGTLSELESIIHHKKVISPALVIVGEVVAETEDYILNNGALKNTFNIRKAL
jgi:uroporphyrin-III C-methyltransferase/precorrin-2 dehydrogenase/sirohydrochlorin ferrochelatase